MTAFSDSLCDTSNANISGIDEQERHRDQIAVGVSGVDNVTVVYTYTVSNGGAHNYYHDTKTGLTYQSSAYW